MKKLQGMKNGFSSLENKKLNSPKIIMGGLSTNVRTTSPTGANGNPGNTGDTAICNDGKQVATLEID